MRKWKSSEEKKRTEQLSVEWECIKKKHSTPTISSKNQTRKTSELSHLTGQRFRRGDVSHIPSIEDSVGIAAKKAIPVYTGTDMIGISQAHKSNLIPVFSPEQAQDIAKMRRG